MSNTRPIVVDPADAPVPVGPPTPRMERRELLDHADRWVGWVRTEAGLAGGWHHHGERDSYIYVIRGTVTIDHGPAGRERLLARAGDFIFVPRRLVHRETTSSDEPAEFFVVRVGMGPQSVYVEGPEAGP
jgi:uncharacterized RmlC-like cupin family protein